MDLLLTTYSTLELHSQVTRPVGAAEPQMICQDISCFSLFLSIFFYHGRFFLIIFNYQTAKWKEKHA